MKRDFKGIWIDREIWLNPDLDITEKALFAEINSLDCDNGCTASNQYFIDFFKISERTVTRAITHLKALGLIESSFDGRIRTLRVVKLTTLPRQNDEQNNIRDISNNLNNSNNKQQVLFNTNKEVLEVRKNGPGQWFVDTYNSICVSLPQCKRLNAKRTKGISNILKKYSEEEILEVFNNLENSDFCKGKNDSGWKADIDFLLKEDKFDRILEGRYNNKRRCNAEEISSNGPKYRVSAEEKEEMRKAVERGDLKEY